MNLTESLLTALKAGGAREIFGIPGDFALPYFEVIERSKILPLYTLSHEPAVGFAADAAARFTGGLGVAAVTYGAGALNVVNAIAQAYAEKSPVVVISGAPGLSEANHGLLLHHQAKTLDSQYRIFQEITCDQVVLDNVITAPEKIARVLQNCCEMSRPVYIEIPRDMAQVECEAVPPLAVSRVESEAVRECAQSIMKRLLSASQPLFMIGVEVRRFGLEQKVEALVAALKIPFACGFMGSGLLVDSPYRAGIYLGDAGDRSLADTVENSDCLVMLGVILSDTNFGVSAGRIDIQRAIHAENRNVRMGYHHYPQIPLEALVDELLKIAEPLSNVSAQARSLRPADDYPSLSVDDNLLRPDDIAAVINDLIADQGPVPIASDIGDCLFAILNTRPSPIAAPGYYASMGFGIPAGLGIQASTGERPVVLLGDGAFQMTGMELGNCSRYGWDPIVLVLNNKTWGMLAVFQPEAEYNNLGDWKLADMANSLGGEGQRVTTRKELSAALDRALATRGKFQLIEVMIAKEDLSTTLNNYVSTLRKMHGH